MKKILVIGADGFIGGKLTTYLYLQGTEIIAMIPKGLKNYVPIQSTTIKYIEFDFDSILEEDYSNSLDGVDTIYNLAWQGVNSTDRNNIDIQSMNILYNIKVVQLAHKYQIKRLIIPGSAAEFSYSKNVIDGSGTPTPSDLYSATKVATRDICSTLCKQYSIEMIWTLITSIYGPGRDDNNLISYVIKSLLQGKKTSCTKLEQQWDYIYIDDLITALYLVGQYGKKGCIYPIGSGEHRHLYEYIEIIHQLTNPDIPIGIGDIPYKSSIIDNQIMDISLLQQDTGFVPQFTFQEGIKNVINYSQSIL